MGFLSRQAKGEEPGQGGDNEELYEKLFPKIGRDFVYKEDFERIVDALMRIVDPLGASPIDFKSNVKAVQKAREYKEMLDTGEDGSKKYKDLINLDEDEDNKVSSTATGGGNSAMSGSSPNKESSVSSTATGGGSRITSKEPNQFGVGATDQENHV